MSLSNRISIVVGIHNMGYLAYWNEVYQQIHLTMSFHQRANLQALDRCKSWKRNCNSMIETKRKRSKKRHENMHDLMKQQQVLKYWGICWIERHSIEMYHLYLIHFRVFCRTIQVCWKNIPKISRDWLELLGINWNSFSVLQWLWYGILLEQKQQT